MKKFLLLILSALLSVSAFAHDELTIDYTHWSIMLKGGVQRNGWAKFNDKAILKSDDKVFTPIYGAEIERTFNHLWGMSISGQMYDFYGSFNGNGYNFFVSGDAIEGALLGSINLSNLLAEDRSERARKFNIYFRAGVGLTYYKTDQKAVMTQYNNDRNTGFIDSNGNRIIGTDRNTDFDKDYKKTTIVIPTEFQFEYNFCKPLALGLIVGQRWHTSQHFGMPDIPKSDNQGNVHNEHAIGRHVLLWDAQLSLRWKIASTGDNKHIRNYVPELKEEVALVKAYDDAPLLARLDAIEGRLDGVEQAIKDHDDIMQKLGQNKIDFTDEDMVIVPIVEFDLDSYRIRNNESIDLDKLAAALVQQPNNFTVYVAGHTDNRASDAHNDVLSQNRANAVKNYLQARGVKQSIVPTGYGKRVPLRTGNTEEDHQRNRRVEIRFSQK